MTQKKKLPLTWWKQKRVVIHKDELQETDVGGQGGHNTSPRMNAFRRLVWAERDRLRREEGYQGLTKRDELRRVQRMMNSFIEDNGGRVVKQVPGYSNYCYVLFASEALPVLGKMLHGKPAKVTATPPTPVNDDDDNSIGSWPLEESDLDDLQDVNIADIWYSNQI